MTQYYQWPFEFLLNNPREIKDDRGFSGAICPTERNNKALSGK
ncbi:hypothetical protein [Chryseobacterium sp.]|nr:hypothetical protein [Chryseobacterium sp.]